MSPPQMTATPAMQDLFSGVQRLDMRELKKFSEQVSLFYVQRKTPHLSARETELLQKINRGFPVSVWQPYKQLIVKRNDETLTEDEYQQLITLSDQLEEMNAERMGYLIELSQLRKQPLQKVMDDLGIHPLSHE